MSAVWNYELASNLEAIRPASIEFREWADPIVGLAVAADCELALVEACNNLIQHAGVKSAIGLSAEVSVEEIVLVVRDGTEGFDWPEKADLPAANAEGGRGIYLIYALMTGVEYTRRRGANELRMWRRF